MSENRRIHLRVGTAAEWVTHNPILGLGEVGYESDTKILRIGDGATAFTSLTGLSFASVQPSRTIATGTGLTGGGDLSANRTLALVGQALALHNLGTNGMIARTGSGTVAARTIAGTAPIVVTNGDGVAGNPTVALGSITSLQTTITDSDTAIPTSGAVVDLFATTRTLLGTMNTTSGASKSLTSLVLTPYKALHFVFDGVSLSSAVHCDLGGVRCSASPNPSSAMFGVFDLDLATGVFMGNVGPANENVQIWGGKTAYRNATTSITVAPASGNFDAGQILVYGLK